MLVDLRDRVGVGTEQRQVAVDCFNRAELGVWNKAPFGLAVGGREEHVRRHRDDESFWR